MVVHLNIHICGRVQKVGFRYYAQKTAASLDLYGFVMNRYDGSVYAEVEGEEDIVAIFCDWCRIGPTMAEISDFKVSEAKVEGFKTFEVRPTGE
jgi:acylphosphatase